MQLDYYTEDGPEWEWWSTAAPASHHQGAAVAHGYTLADIDTLARMAMRRSIGWSLLDATGRYQACYDGVVDLLFTAEEAPTERDLIESGWSSLARAYKQVRHDRGLTDNPAQPHGPRFAAYWIGQEGKTTHGDATVERLAVHQVVDSLPQEHRDVLAAMAAYGNRGDAAHGLALATGTFSAQLRRARAVALRLWFDHEVPPPRAAMFNTSRKVASYAQRTPSATCRAGHEWTPENTRWYKPSNGSPKSVRSVARRICRACESASHASRRGRAVAA